MKNFQKSVDKDFLVCYNIIDNKERRKIEMDENRAKQIDEIKLVIDTYTRGMKAFTSYDLASYLVDQNFIPLRHAILREEEIKSEIRKKTAREFAEKLEQICMSRIKRIMTSSKVLLGLLRGV